jgi:hypothetical protein
MDPAETVQSVFQNGSGETTTEDFSKAMARILAALAKTQAARSEAAP